MLRKTAPQLVLALALATVVCAEPALAQTDVVTPVALPVGRSYPITTPVPISKVSVALPDIADVIVISPRELVVNAKTAGQTDAIVWLQNGTRDHLRVSVRSPSDRPQVAVAIKFAEVRRSLLRDIGLSALYRGPHARVGTGDFNTDKPFGTDGSITLPSSAGFGTVLTDFNTQRLLALLDVNEQNGLSHTLAEPDVLAGDGETASFLAGGEVPIPVVQTSGAAGNAGGAPVTILFKEYGVRLNFTPQIVGDSLVKLTLTPEVSSLDYANAITLSGFSIPAFRTRRVTTTVDVHRNQSLIISGLFDDERQKTKNGVPYLQDIPIIGQLFSSTSWQNSESELLIVVTPVVIDPMAPPRNRVLPIAPDTALPAKEIIEKRFTTPPTPPSVQIRP